jgi:hypothetical protein
VSVKLVAGFSRGCAHPARQPPISATHSATQKIRSPADGAPVRRRLRAGLPWTALWLRVEVNHHPSGARAPLASNACTTLHVIHTPLKASQAGALLVGTRSRRSSHDLMPLARRCRGRGGRLCCGCLLACRSCVPTPYNPSAPQRRMPT